MCIGAASPASQVRRRLRLPENATRCVATRSRITTADDNGPGSDRGVEARPSPTRASAAKQVASRPGTTASGNGDRRGIDRIKDAKRGGSCGLTNGDGRPVQRGIKPAVFFPGLRLCPRIAGIRLRRGARLPVKVFPVKPQRYLEQQIPAG